MPNGHLFVCRHPFLFSAYYSLLRAYPIHAHGNCLSQTVGDDILSLATRFDDGEGADSRVRRRRTRRPRRRRDLIDFGGLSFSTPTGNSVLSSSSGRFGHFSGEGVKPMFLLRTLGSSQVISRALRSLPSRGSLEYRYLQASHSLFGFKFSIHLFHFQV